MGRVVKLSQAQIEHFDLVSPKLARRVRFYRLPFMFWTDGLTLRSTVLLRKGLGGSSDRLIAHELVHVQQWSRAGMIGFLRWYIGDYVRLRLKGHPHRVAYWRLSAERSARLVSSRWLERRGLVTS